MFSPELERVMSAAIRAIQHAGSHHHIEVDTATVACKDCGGRFAVAEGELVTFTETSPGDGSCRAEAERIRSKRPGRATI